MEGARARWEDGIAAPTTTSTPTMMMEYKEKQTCDVKQKIIYYYLKSVHSSGFTVDTFLCRTSPPYRISAECRAAECLFFYTFFTRQDVR